MIDCGTFDREWLAFHLGIMSRHPEEDRFFGLSEILSKFSTAIDAHGRLVIPHGDHDRACLAQLSATGSGASTRLPPRL